MDTYGTGPITMGKDVDELEKGGCDAAADEATAEGNTPPGDVQNEGKGTVKGEGQKNRRKGV